MLGLDLVLDGFGGRLAHELVRAVVGRLVEVGFALSQGLPLMRVLEGGVVVVARGVALGAAYIAEVLAVQQMLAGTELRALGEDLCVGDVLGSGDLPQAACLRCKT